MRKTARVAHKIVRRLRSHNGSGSKLAKLGRGLKKIAPSRSLHYIKAKPLKAIGLVAMGVSAISSLIIWNRFRNR